MSDKKQVLKKTNKAAKPSNKEILVLLLCGLIVVPLFILPLMYIAKWQDTKINNAIDSNPAYMTCIITDMYPYKGKAIGVVCNLEGKKYYYREGISPEYYRTLNIGDEVTFKYCKDNPNYAVEVEP